MNLRDIKDEIARITAHPLTETDRLAVAYDPAQGARFEVDTSAIESERDDAKESEEHFKSEVAKLEEVRDELAEKLESLEALLSDLKDPDSGLTPQVLRVRQLEAEKSRDDYRAAMTEARRERDALRKRKGVVFNVFAHESAIFEMLHRVRSSESFRNGPHIVGEIADLLQKLTNP